MRRFAKLVASALVAGLTLTGCAHLPLTGEVRQGSVIDAGLSAEQLYYSPSGPVDGASQDEVIMGFLNAGTGPQNDYSVAREYLSAKFRNRWSPDQGVLVETGRPQIAFDEAGHTRVVIQVQSALDAHGVYSALPAGSERVLDFTLTREQGEWRITSAPNLTVLNRPIFDVIFQSYSFYFFDKQFKYLVPDVRWFPARASTSTRMVTELFAGPSEWLSKAVTTAIPEGMKLSIASVTVAAGTAAVDLNSKFLILSPTQQMQFKSQLSATLRQLAGVTEVQILVERSPQSIADFDARATSVAAATPTILTADGFKHLSGAQPSNFGQVRALTVAFNADDFSLSADETHAAIRGNEGVQLILLSALGSTPLLVDNRKDLVRSVFDRQGYLWSMGEAAGSQIRAIGMDGKSTVVPAGWLSLANRQEIAISAEGSRLAARIKTPSGSQVWVSTIIRDEAGKPTGLGTPVQLAPQLASPVSIAWSGETAVAILDSNDGVRALTHLAVVGADSSSLLGIQNGIRVISSPVGEVYVMSRYGELYRYKSSNWDRVAQGIIAVHYAGQ